MVVFHADVTTDFVVFAAVTARRPAEPLDLSPECTVETRRVCRDRPDGQAGIAEPLK